MVVPWSYHRVMAVKKKSLSFDEEVWATIEIRARDAETTPSAYLNNLVIRSERIHRGLQAVADWEAEHGAFTAAELAWADDALAGAIDEARRLDASDDEAGLPATDKATRRGDLAS